MLVRHSRATTGGLILLTLTASAACSRPVDLATALQVTDVSTGWFDSGIVNGQNKLVPSVTFRLKNASTDRLRSVQLNTLFMLLPENEEWDATLTQGVLGQGLDAGASTPSITVRGKVGFTSAEPRAEMLQHRLFKDVNVRIFAKYGSSQWVRLGEYRVARQLLTR
jgi:hypothetical protein